jgi:hypothetical protein
MRGTALISAQSLKGLERAILIVGSVTLTATLFLLLSTAFIHFQRGEIDAKLLLTKNEISTLTLTLEKAKKINSKPNTAKELGIVQVALSQLAKKNDCQLQEMSATSDPGLFVSKYQKGADDRGWKQLPIDCQISGSLVSVMTMIRDFTSMSIPIEVQNIDLTPIEKALHGIDRLSAKVTFQLLKQEATR